VAAVDFYSLAEAAGEGDFLGRFRRPVAPALAAAYVAAWTAPGDLVLDPFCQDVAVLRAAAVAGRRAVATTGNPLIALLVRVEAAPAAPAQLQGAVARLAAAPKADTLLGEHLDQLYATACGQCGAQAAAEAFVWDRELATPVLREYRCGRCGHAAREPLPAGEVPRHLGFDPQGMHRRLLAERLRVDDAPPRLADRLTGLYTPRGLYALSALVLKLDLLFADSPLRDALRVALLQTMDEASALHQATEEGWRPVASLAPPRRFREANVWRTFVAAARAVAGGGCALPLVASAEEVLRAGPGAAGVEAGPLPRLTGRLAGRVSLALSQLPRFDSTFAALSYLWSGWLMGKEGSRAAVRLLRQRVPGELHYLQALTAALAALGGALAPRGRVALAFQAPATRYIESLLVAAGGAQLAPVHAWHGPLDGRPAPPLAVRRVEHHVVLARGVAVPPPGDRAVRAGLLAARTAAALLEARGEPAPFGALHGPIWATLGREGLLAGGRSAPEAEALRKRLAVAVGRALEGAEDLEAVPVPGGEAGEALWRLRPAPECSRPLADRTEALVRAALERGPSSEEALQQEVLEALGGQVPSWPLLRACLESYGVEIEPRRWALAEEEREITAPAWRERLLQALGELGERLGYEPGEAAGCDLAWAEAGALRLGFRLQASVAIAPLLGAVCAGRRLLVIPTRRAALWRHRLAAQPLWRAELERLGWAFLREAALLGLLDGAADPARFEAALGLDEGGGQLALFAP